MTLEQYLKYNCERQVIDHAIRAEIGKDGNPRFYIHPANVSGETLDFVVTENQLHPAYVWGGLQQLADANPIPTDIRAKMDADRAKAEMSNNEIRQARAEQEVLWNLLRQKAREHQKKKRKHETALV